MCPKDDWMDIQELKDYIHVPIKSIYSLVHHKKIPYTKIGRRLRFNRDDIDEWLRRNSVQVHPEKLPTEKKQAQHIC